MGIGKTQRYEPEASTFNRSSYRRYVSRKEEKRYCEFITDVQLSQSEVERFKQKFEIPKFKSNRYGGLHYSGFIDLSEEKPKISNYQLCKIEAIDNMRAAFVLAAFVLAALAGVKK